MQYTVYNSVMNKFLRTYLMNRIDIVSLFWQFLQPNRSAVATIEMIVELVDSLIGTTAASAMVYKIICF